MDLVPEAPRTSAGGAALPPLLSIMFINLLGFGIVVPLLPFYAKSFSAPAWQIALIFSAYAIGAFFGEPFWGRVTRSRRPQAYPDQHGERQLPLLHGHGLCAEHPIRLLCPHPG